MLQQRLLLLLGYLQQTYSRQSEGGDNLQVRNKGFFFSLATCSKHTADSLRVVPSTGVQQRLLLLLGYLQQTYSRQSEGGAIYRCATICQSMLTRCQHKWHSPHSPVEGARFSKFRKIFPKIFLGKW